MAHFQVPALSGPPARSRILQRSLGRSRREGLARNVYAAEESAEMSGQQN